MILYDGKKNFKLVEDLCYSLFMRSASKSGLYLVPLPPTSSAIRYHAFRTYHQIQSWKGNVMPPVEWGWQLEDGTLTPTKMTMAPASDELLNLISCGCLKGYLSACSCRKARMLLKSQSLVNKLEIYFVSLFCCSRSQMFSHVFWLYGYLLPKRRCPGNGS